MAGTRVRSPIGVALVATVLAGLVTALVLSFVLDGRRAAGGLGAHPGSRAPGDGTGPAAVGPEGEAAPDFTFEPLDGGADVDFDDVPGRAAGA